MVRFGVTYEDDGFSDSPFISAWLEEKEARRKANAIRKAEKEALQKAETQKAEKEMPKKEALRKAEKKARRLVNTLRNMGTINKAEKEALWKAEDDACRLTKALQKEENAIWKAGEAARKAEEAGRKAEEARKAEKGLSGLRPT
jgi:Lon protease-like protein